MYFKIIAVLQVFLHKALLSAGDVDELTEEAKAVYDDFCWLTADEIRRTVRRKYWKAVHPVLHDY